MTETAKNLAFSALVPFALELLFFPVSCPNPFKAPSEQTGCKNVFGWTMGGSVGFVDESVMVVGGIVIGVLIYLGAGMLEDWKRRQKGGA